MIPSSRQILKQYFKLDSFRPLQEEIIQAVLEKKDVLALLPTGGGKSLCFQVPAMMNEGMCLVISPLVALMRDQSESLRRKGITVFTIQAGMSRKEVMNALRTAAESNCKFLYLSPERLETNLFKEYLPSLHITLIAIDEAHCISQWGYDFRPSYLHIADLREELKDIPVLALTASATKEVQRDICEKLQFKDQIIFRQSMARANLSYSAFHTELKHNKIVEILENVSGSSIIYCKSRRRTKEIADLLNSNGIQADFYHAGLGSEERNKRQGAWIKNETRVIVCTNAFGMGIDKSDVRTVIHADLPDCLESYYQEAGRSGRDGKKSYAVLLYTEKELNGLKELPEIHFPKFEVIRVVYQAVMNYLQAPSGSSEGSYFDFDMDDFCRKFRLDSQLVEYALKALEQEEILSLSQQVFLPSRIMFEMNKDLLYEFENNHPQLEPMIKILLRSYPGILDQLVSIHEKTISYLLKKGLKEVIEELIKLNRFGVIDYLPQKDSPQLFFIQNRVKTEELRINSANFQKRKKEYENRITSLREYVKWELLCRSKYIANYFGDEEARPCGICDNCLKLKKG
jgi:ATP-dependent DNA helicase RecQ